jgi:hypothetical protein
MKKVSGRVRNKEDVCRRVGEKDINKKKKWLNFGLKIKIK